MGVYSFLKGDSTVPCVMTRLFLNTRCTQRDGHGGRSEGGGRGVWLLDPRKCIFLDVKGLNGGIWERKGPTVTKLTVFLINHCAYILEILHSLKWWTYMSCRAYLNPFIFTNEPVDVFSKTIWL